MVEQIVEPGGVDEAQQELDGQQGIPAAPVYATAEDVQRIISQQLGAFQTQVSSLASKVDRAANAVRRDVEASTAQRLQQLEQEFRERQVMDAIPEELREQLGPALKQVLRQNTPQPLQAQVQEPVVQPTQVQEALTGQMQIITALGGNPQDPSINYAAFMQGDTTTFIASVRAHLQNTFQKTAPAAPAPPPARTAAPAQRNPPVEAPSGGTRTDLSTVDAVRDAYLTDKLTKEQYMERMAQLGQPV